MHVYIKTNTHIGDYLWDLLEWLAGCGSASPTMTVCQWKRQESSSCSLHEAGGLSWSLAYAGILKK